MPTLYFDNIHSSLLPSSSLLLHFPSQLEDSVEKVEMSQVQRLTALSWASFS